MRFDMTGKNSLEKKLKKKKKIGDESSFITVFVEDERL